MTLAFRCVQGSVAYRTSKAMAERSEAICSKGDTFFGKRLTAQETGFCSGGLRHIFKIFSRFLKKTGKDDKDDSY